MTFTQTNRNFWNELPDELKQAWKIFSFIENELWEFRNIIEFSEQNQNTHSLKLRSIIIQACAEVEMSLTRLLKTVSGNNSNLKRPTILDLKNELKKHLEWDCLKNYKITSISSWPGEIKPLEEETGGWGWWESCNDAKHRSGIPKQPNDTLKDSSTLKNATHAVGALLLLLIEESLQINENFEISWLMSCGLQPCFLMKPDTEPLVTTISRKIQRAPRKVIF